MASKIFENLLIEKIDQFKLSFSNTSKEVFYDADKKRIFHTGEYGTYREAIVRDFLKFIVPKSLDLSTGFLITTLNDVSTQCDIVIFDAEMTPLYESGDRQRFFPVETVHAIGEVKSTLSKAKFKTALNKLAKNKALSERMKNAPTILKKSPPGPYDPVNDHYDVIPSFLICKKLDFDITNIANEIDGFYKASVLHRHRHNMILSIDDGVLLYFDSNNMTLPYSRHKGVNLKNRFIFPGTNAYTHFKCFATYMFMMSASKTLFYPEITDYMGTVSGGFQNDQV